MHDYTLFIIDAQPGREGEYGNTCPWYKAVTDDVVNSLEREVLQAKALGAAICDVRVTHFSWNDEDFGPTDERILRHCRGYARHSSTTKLGWGDGAGEVLSHYRRIESMDPKRIKIGGCRTNACVLEFVRGLRAALPDCEIEVVMDCCGELPHYKNDWALYSDIPNVKLVEPVLR